MVAISCENKGCGSEFTLNDKPVRCEYCRKDFCFSHREPWYHNCKAIIPRRVHKELEIKETKKIEQANKIDYNEDYTRRDYALGLVVVIIAFLILVITQVVYIL